MKGEMYETCEWCIYFVLIKSSSWFNMYDLGCEWSSS